MKFFMETKFRLVAILVLILSSSFAKTAYSDPTTTSSVQGYTIAKDKKGTVVDCYSSTKSMPDESLCEKYSLVKNSECSLIPSTAHLDARQYVCNPPGESYCKKDSDCQVLGKSKCVVKPGSTKKFEDQFDDESALDSENTKVGICVAGGGSGEDNAFGQAICNLMSVVTGNAGRAVVGVVVIVVGIMFFLGKVTWSLVLAIALGAGAIFGAPAVVRLVTGAPFTCGGK